MFTALGLVGSLFGGWLLLRVVRSRVLCHALPIYQPAMLGSIFGVPAGYWIYDRLFQAERPPLMPTTTLVPETPTPDPDPVDVGGQL